MDFDRGNSVSGQKDFQIQGSWIPATPVKPILPRPQPIYANRQDNELLWMVGGGGGSGSGFSNGFSRENQAQGIAASFDSTAGFEPDTGFHNWEAALAPKSQASGNNVGGRTYENGSSIGPMTDGWNNIPFVDLLAQAASGATSSQPDVIAATSNYDFGFNSQMGSSCCWSESTCVSSLPATNHDLSLGSQLWTNGTCTPQQTQCKLPVSCQQNYDLNVLPGTMAELFSRRYSQFAPITPDNAKRLESQNVSEVTNQCIDGRTNRENDYQKNNEVDTTRAEVIELQCEKELSQADSSLPAISTPATENQNLEKGSNNDGIDLNKTPQQKPRRKKHRPKVVIEGKPKRTPKPATPKPNASNENPTGKRKYVRRKGLDKPQTTPPPDVVRETTDPKQVEPTTRSARRVLNFELDGQGIHGSSQEQQFYNGNVQTKSTVQLCQGIEVTVGNTQTGIAHELVCSVNQVLQDYISLPTRQTPSTRHPTNIDHPYSPATTGPPQERLKANARIGNDIQGTGQVTADDKQGRHEQILLHFNEQFTIRSPNDSNCSTSARLAEGQATGNKRACAHITDRVDHGTMNINGTRCNSMQDYEAFRVNEFNSRMSSMHFPEIYKKRRTEKGQTSTTSSTSSSVTTAKNVIKLVRERLQNQTKASLLESKPNGWVSAPQFHMTRAPTTQGEAVRGVDEDKLRAFECMMALGRTERLTKKRSKGPTRVRDLASLTGIAENKLLATLPGKRALLGGEAQGAEISHGPQNCIEALVAETRATLARRKRSKKRNSFINSVPSSTNALHLHQNSVLYARQKFLSGQTGPPPEVIWKHMLSVDAITERLKHLDINLESNMVSYQEYNNALVPYTVRYQEQNALLPYNMVNQEQNALVIYKRDGTIVSFDGPFDPIKKRRPRPKVDLDEETTKVWKLLLENINNEGIDGTDEDKARWWEEERRVFRGRADSFIARMHLVQGDRRFSKWKGSVVDSVVGVFLTQNVSDHLSSSAYMSLAARYPLKPKSNQQQCYEEGTRILVEEPELCILDMQDTINWEEKIPDNLVCDQSSMTQYDPEHSDEKEVANSNESFGSSTGGLNSINDSKSKLDFSRSELENFHESAVKRSSTQSMERGEASILGDRTAIEDVVSSQSSVDSSIAQTAERRMGPFLESNSEAQDPAAGPNSTSFEGSTSFLKLLHMAAAPMFNEGHSQGSHLVPSEKNSKDARNQPDVIGHDKQRQNLDQLDDPESSLVSSAPPTDHHSNLTPNLTVQGVECIELLEEESRSSDVTDIKNENRMCARSRFTEESSSKDTLQTKLTVSVQESLKVSSDSSIQSTNNFENERNETDQSQGRPVGEPKNVESLAQGKNNELQQNINLPHFLGEILDVTESTSALNNRKNTNESNLKEPDHASVKALNETAVETLPGKRRRVVKEKNKVFDWDSLRKQAQVNGKSREKTANTMDSLDWEAVRCADVNEIAYTIRERGMNNMLAERIKDFLNRLVREHESLDLEWLRDVPPDKAKEYLLSIRGLGLKSVECVRLLTLHHLAFPVDTNVGRIAVRLGWVPLQPLPESLQLHLLEMYPVLESIQKYLWPRLCKLDQRTLYELHYQMITFGKVFCTKSKPNCNACPMRGECRHFASAFASARLALPGPEEKSIVSATENRAADQHAAISTNRLQLPLPEANDQSIVSHQLEANQPSEATQPSEAKCCNNEPIIEVPATPEPECTQISESDIEDACYEDPDEIPTIKLNIEEFTQNLQNYMQKNMELQEGEMSRALVALTPEVASIPTPKLKNVSRLRTEHQVYELPDSHPLLQGLERREPDDPCSYLLAIWTPGETANSIQPPEGKCSSQEVGELCAEKTCFSCNSIREANTQTVRGTLLIPCRTAMRGSFPLNGTYFQVNEVFADHDSSLNPIDVPRSWIWNLPRRTVYFGTSIPTIFKGLSTEGIQYCFWRGFVCVRGFDQKTRAPRPLMARLHFPASKLVKTKAKPPGE